VAAAYAVTYHDAYGLTPVDLPGTASLRIYGYLRLSAVARGAHIHPATLLRLNPMFKQGYIPDHPQGYRLRVPASQLAAVQSYLWGQDNLVELPDTEQQDRYAFAESMGMHPYRLLLGCSPESVVSAPLTGAYAGLERGMLAHVARQYRRLASL
jgi:hypothetical protein